MTDHPDSENCAAWWASVAALSVVLLAPLLIADVPPLLDYPNHLARMVLVAAGPGDPVLGRIFTPDWSVIPNLAGDVIGMCLLRILPVHIAGRCLLGGVLLLNLAGALSLHRALFGRRSFWPLASGLVAYNCTFLLGFINWQIGCGLAMLFAAGWLRWRQRRPWFTIVSGALASVLLFFCHLMGVVFFLILIGSAELGAIRSVRGLLSRSAGLAAVVAGPLLLSWRTALHDMPAATDWPLWHVKFENAGSPFINYVAPLDVFTAAIIYGGLALGLTSGALVIAARAVPAAILLPIAYFVLPFDFMSGSFLDMRFAVMFGFLVFAAVEPSRHSRVIAVALTLLFAVRMGVVADIWMQHRHDLTALRTVTESVHPGAKVYFTNVPQEESPTYWGDGPRARRLSNRLRADYHLPALLLIEHGAFWPVLFANPAQQPIRLRPDYARLAAEAHDIPSHARLKVDPDLAWPALRDFDNVLMLEAGADPNLASFMPGCLTLVARSDFAALFRVRRDVAACSAR